MDSRLLVTGAGSSASENLVRSLRTADPGLHIVGCHDDRFVLKSSAIDRRYLVPRLSDPRAAEVLRRLIERERIDLVIPTSDADVGAVSHLRGGLPARCFLPDEEAIRLCQDKFELTARLRAAGIPAPETHAVTDLDEIESWLARVSGR